MNTRKALSLILSIAMILSAFVFSIPAVSAASTPKITVNGTCYVGKALSVTCTDYYSTSDWLALVPAADIDGGLKNVQSANYHDEWKYVTDARTMTPSAKGDYYILYIKAEKSAPYAYEADPLVRITAINEGDPVPGPTPDHDPIEKDYYVMYGATGDGTSASSPAGTIPAIVDKIKNDGLTAGDTATVYVIDAEDALTYRPACNGRGQTGHHMLGWTYPSHYDCLIVFKGYNSTDSHLCTSQTFGGTNMMNLNGPTKFEDIMLVMTRASDASIVTCGYDCEVASSCTMGQMPEFANVGDTWNGKFTDYGFIIKPSRNNIGNETLGGGGTMRLSINSPKSLRIDIPGYRETATYPDDLNIYVDKASGVTILEEAIAQSTYGSNVNFIFGDVGDIGVSVKVTDPSYKMIVKGAVQIIKNKASALSSNYADAFIAGKGYYVMNLPENGLLSVTEKAGTFKVNTDKPMLAVSSKGSAVAITGETVTLEPGEYDVSYLEGNIDDMKASVSFDGVPSDTLYLKGYSMTLPTLDNTISAEFIGWQYDGKNYAPGGVFAIPSNQTETINFVSCWESLGEIVAVYVDQTNGSDSNIGSSPSAALKTLEAAFKALASRTADIKKIVIVGTYDHDHGLPTHDSMITICGDSSSSQFNYALTDSMTINGPTTFENLKVSCIANSKFINTADSELVLGEGLTLSKVSIHFGHEDGKASAHQKLTLKSGTITRLYLGSNYVTSYTAHDGCDVIMEGGTISDLTFGSDGWLATHKGTTFTGNCNFYIYGGTISKITTAREPLFEKGVNFFYFNGMKPQSAPVSPCYSFTDTTDGSDYYLTPTDEAGVFHVESADGFTAIAASTDSGSYASSEGLLSVAEGTYALTFTDKLFYINTGEKIEVYEDCALDFSKEAHREYADKLFIGWALEGEEPGTYVGAKSGSVVKGGTTVYARYLDYDEFDKYNVDEDPDESGDFYIYGVQMRLADGDKQQGLRFITELSDNLRLGLPGIKEYGTALLPSDLVLGRDMLLEEKIVTCSDGIKSQTRKIYTSDAIPTLVPAVNTFKTLSDGIQYTVCVTGITPEKYDRFYTVRGYLKWTDYQGNEQLLLTDYYECNLYKTAVAALNDTSASYDDKSIEAFKTVTDYVENDKREAYFKANYDSRSYVDDNGNLVLVPAEQADRINLLSGYQGVNWKFYGQYDEKTPATSGKNDDRYKMYSLKNGLKVREVTIDSGKSAESDDTIEIVHFADAHFDYLNSVDFEEKNPALMSTAIYRSWYFGSAVNAGFKTGAYANFFDKTVVTGDMIDYLSQGSADMTKAVLFDRLYRASYAIGNHEPTRKMQGIVADPNASNIYPTLEHIWPNDPYYLSEILSDDNGVEKVMIVTMDNNRDEYYNNQSALLSADIKIAREKNIPILIFQHDPIATNGNPDKDMSQAVYAIYEKGDIAGMPSNFASMFAGSASHYKAGSETQKTFDVIVQNADVIKGLFCGHWHNHMYSEVYASYTDPSTGKKVEYDTDGNHIVIPQYVVTANAYGGSCFKITVK